MVAGMHLSEVLLELSNGATSELVADTSSRNLHRPTSDRIDSLPVRFVGVHARLDVLSIQRIGHSILRTRSSYPAAALSHVSMGNLNQVLMSEAIDTRAVALLRQLG
jgi:hypothetical protein